MGRSLPHAADAADIDPRSATSSEQIQSSRLFQGAKILGGVDLGAILSLAYVVGRCRRAEALSKQLPDRIEARFDWSTSTVRSARAVRAECWRQVAARDARSRQRADRYSDGNDLQRDRFDRSFQDQPVRLRHRLVRSADLHQRRAARNLMSRSICIPATKALPSAVRWNSSTSCESRTLERLQRSAWPFGHAKRHQLQSIR